MYENKVYENRVRAREYDGPGMVYGFVGTAGFVSWLVCLAIASLFLTGCKNGGAPTTPPPPPNQDQYEPLPATHQLKDASGKGLKMWATMFPGVNPPRGSTVGEGAITAIPIEARNGNKKYGAGFHAYWSRDDRIDSADESAGALGVPPNGSQRGNLQRWSGGFAPRYLLIKGTLDGETGETSFFLDYR